MRVATALIALGALLFTADLAVRHFANTGLFPMPAPVGGLAMIAGWGLLVVVAVLGPRL
jgi:uncharacterized membrane protein YgdD (TMEM256/DUF423 family)